MQDQYFQTSMIYFPYPKQTFTCKLYSCLKNEDKLLNLAILK